MYCSTSCKETAMKRRQRGRPVADGSPSAVGEALVAGRVAAAVRTSRDAQRRMYRSRLSRNKNIQRARELGAVAATARRRAESVVAEQAERTAALRLALVESRRQVMVLEGQLRAGTGVAPDSGVVEKLRERLAAGNAAYSELMAMHGKLRAAFDAQRGQARMVGAYVKDWDMLCMRLYQGSRARNVPAADRAVLARWSAWRATAAGVAK